MVLTHEDYVCGFHCDVCAGTKCNTERGGGQGGGVVDAVADLMLTNVGMGGVPLRRRHLVPAFVG